jgi:hypothetical protein
MIVVSIKSLHVANIVIFQGLAFAMPSIRKLSNFHLAMSLFVMGGLQGVQWKGNWPFY